MAGKPRKELTDAERAAKVAKQQADFKKLTQQRLPKLLAQFRMIGNLANYKPTETQRDWLFKQIEEAAKAAHARFLPDAPAQADTLEIPD